MTDFQNGKILNQMIKFQCKRNCVIHNFEQLCVPADLLLPKTMCNEARILGLFTLVKLMFMTENSLNLMLQFK